jgi:hypothetical protein
LVVGFFLIFFTLRVQFHARGAPLANDTGVVSAINSSNREGTMLTTLLNRCVRSLRSNSPRVTHYPKPIIEALEERSLLDANAYVRALYASILNRPSPTDAEVNGWVAQINSGVSLEAVAKTFAGSSERFGIIVSDDYTQILGRTVDPAGLNFWVNQMANGMSQAQVQASILSTEEAFAHSFGSNKGFIMLSFQTALGRDVDDAASNFFINELADGASRFDVASQIVNSHEAHLHAIDQIYLQLLGRNADADANAFFGTNLDNGGSLIDVVATVGASTEFQEASGGVV